MALTVYQSPPSLGVKIGVGRPGHAWLQQQAALSFLLHLSAEWSTEAGTHDTEEAHSAGSKVPLAFSAPAWSGGDEVCTMEALQATKHLTPCTSHQPISVSGCQSHHLLRRRALLQTSTQTQHPKLKPRSHGVLQ